MNEQISKIIEYESESYKVDFKSEQYPLGKNPKRSEFLKDIMAFANHISDEDKYIIIGIKDSNSENKTILEVSALIDEAKYQEFLLENVEPKINFEYKPVQYNGKQIAYFRIFNNTDRPYLFKKDIINQNGKVDYKYGEGFIRTGTTSRKIGRKELDDINKSKMNYSDRRSDITIESTIGSSQNNNLDLFDIKYIDVNIINHSNKSIDLDIELKIFKSENYLIAYEYDMIKKVEEERQKKSILSWTNISIPIERKPILLNLNIDFEETATELIFKRKPFKTKTGFRLLQNNNEKEVFQQNILLLKGEVSTVRGFLVIRSDDFINGPLRKEISFGK